ncbi:hypothetical protein [Palleronia sp. LCG004]|uniref:hypothetical protein n=1 Tax=Palleronia sp. LCG004 TaxID=3079304 RepID=UPI0029430B3E|nr:hypothetical protein [Palleronia sp. LCG004]WOI54953.1 hypothetical protein RVY76_07700 [Palleronia sp. LCG004]
MIISAVGRDALAQRRGLARWLLWLEVRTYDTGEIQPAGIWNGEHDQSFEIEGETRDYRGIAGLLKPEPLTYEAGTNIRLQRIRIALSPDAESLLRNYDSRLAPAELHLAIFDRETHELISIDQAIEGFVDSAPIKEGALENGMSVAVCDLTLATSARAGTRTLGTKKSDAALRKRGGDRGYRYSVISGQIPVWWGEDRK